MTDEETLEAIVATEIERLARMARLGDHGTAGPDSTPTAPTMPLPALWKDGWWAGARRVDAHPGRIGGVIRPWSVVVHTTDMPDEDWDALVNSWRTRPGDGACAHFLIGRDEAHGVIQLAPITRNANHAGGPGHGVYDTVGAKNVHPNLVAVGIELMCAGGVRSIDGAWRFVEDGKVHGEPIADADVIPDPQRPGRGWHKVTDWQYEQLGHLLDELEPVLAAMPSGARTRSTGETVPMWGSPKTARVVGHVSLDPAHRADPWPPTCERLFRS